MESSKSSFSGNTLVKEEIPSTHHASPHYEAFTICTMHKSTVTKQHSIFKLFTRQTKTVNLSHREWGRLAASQKEIASYLSNEVKDENPTIRRWQSRMRTMDILLSLLAEVAWSVTNIVDERNKLSDHGRRGRKKNYVVELVSEWPVTNKLSPDTSVMKRWQMERI